MDAPLFTFGCATRDDKLVRSVLAVLRQDHPHLLDRSEFIVVDNSETTHIDGVEQPNPYAIDLQKALKGIPGVRYIRANGRSSSSLYRERLFKEAKGKYVVCFDPHVFFPPGSIDCLVRYYEAHPETSDLIMGPLVSGLTNRVTGTHQRLYDWEPGQTPKDARVIQDVVCRGNQIGTWAVDERGLDPNGPAFEIQHQGMGAFSCRREAWVGFHPSFYGFGGCETYIMEKFRRRGHKVLCLPGFRWDHSFYEPTKKPYNPRAIDRVRNYLVGFKELNAPELYAATVAHYTKQSGYGESLVKRAAQEADAILNPKPDPKKKQADKPAKPAPKVNPHYLAALARSKFTEAETLPEFLYGEIRKAQAESRTLEFGSGITTLALDANRCDHTAVERDATKFDRLRPLLFHPESTKLVHDPDGTWKNRFEELFSLVIVHDVSLVPAGLDLGTVIVPGGVIFIAETQKPENRAYAEQVSKQVDLPAKKWPAKYGVHKERSFHVLKQPPEPLGEGPGTELKAIMASHGFPACQQCENLARRMNAWGVDGCRENMEMIVKDMMPRAKHWLKKGQPYAKGFLRYLEAGAKALIEATHTEDLSMRKAVVYQVNQAIANFEKKVAEPVSSAP